VRYSFASFNAIVSLNSPPKTPPTAPDFETLEHRESVTLANPIPCAGRQIPNAPSVSIIASSSNSPCSLGDERD